MKKILMFFLATLMLFSACKKNNPVNNSDADGEYIVTEVELNGEIYTPEDDGLDGDITIENKGTRMSMYVEMDDEDEVIDQTVNITVKRSGNRFDIYEEDGKTRLGYIDGNVLELRSDDGKNQARIRAEK